MPRPPAKPSDIRALQKQRTRILGEITSLGDLRPGTLSKKYTRCGRADCACRDEGNPGHGPYWILTLYRDGKKTSRSIPAAHAAQTQQHIEHCQQLRRLTGDLITVGEQICDARLADAGSAEPDTRKWS